MKNSGEERKAGLMKVAEEVIDELLDWSGVPGHTKVYQITKEKGVDKTLSLMQAVSERCAFQTKSLS